MATSIRDFFYLDIERVRSFVAQLREGVPEAIQESHSRTGKGGIQAIVGAQYSLEKTDSETRSVHHYLYSILETALQESEKLVIVDEQYPTDRWNRDSLPDGTLILAQARIQLLDIERTVDAIRGFPRLWGAMKRFQQHSTLQSSGPHPRAKHRTAQLDTTDELGLSAKDISELAELVQRLYGDVMRLRVYPFPDDAYYFSASLLVDRLHYERSSLFAAGAIVPASKWHIMGIVDQMRAHSDVQVASGGDQTLEDVLIGLLQQFSTLAELTLSLKWPAIGLTPLAIYRVL